MPASNLGPAHHHDLVTPKTQRLSCLTNGRWKNWGTCQALAAGLSYGALGDARADAGREGTRSLAGMETVGYL